MQLEPPPVRLLNASTVAFFTTVANASFSPRALGWLTQELVLAQLASLLGQSLPPLKNNL